ncbi:membrane protein EpsK [Parabacteroides sp. PH5-13]|uniref:hypothetical protein n=1 Tax=unclassified Parabacteroides TaxID=2649774 RepID=UPI0024758BFE|nr:MULTISPECIES: hypothetical protein [unclassified Parabacteroides]MDH6305585.1 membrane protein EpsK [Parabacteroides sp. PH5-39]MDH6319860.1 membrane protein EpsK [Parabacteroides sp. PH5-13]MDH6323549.1 membrane protein EpsK [Parabacteroides sp. PH5-8]MDH6384661.1 membrane protein EpsK [Parabacteroides sp. PH5-17]MDH6394016.1 membrane protein EpsK [Parabacteroides sp. PFB2-22]
MADNVDIKSKIQTRKNLIFNALSLFANIAVGMFYTPFLVRHLGIVAYGILPLVLIINQYISVLTASLTSSLTRFYSVAIQQGKDLEASKCLNTALGVVLIIFIILLIPLYFIIARVDKIFTIPTDLLNQSKILFVFTISSFYISLISSVFNITLYANNRLDYLNIVKIIRVSLKCGFVIVLFYGFNNNIIYVGYANFLTEIIALIFSLYLFKKTSGSKIKIAPKYFDKIVLSSMLGMTIWVMIVQLGDIGLYRIDNFVINIFWSTKESGVLGAFSELGTYIMMSLSVFSSIFGPLILIAYSKEKHDDVIQISVDQSLIVGVVAAIVVGLVIGFSKQISLVWLGEGFEIFYMWLILKVVLIPFYTTAGIFSFIYRAWNKVRVPAFITLGLGIVNLIIVVLIAKFMSPDYKAILIILAIGTLLGVIQCYISIGWYVSKIYPVMRVPIFKNFIIITLLLALISLFSYITSEFFPYKSVFKLLIVGGIVAIISFLGAFRFVLAKNQRIYLLGLFKLK